MYICQIDHRYLPPVTLICPLFVLFASLRICIHSALRSVAETEVARRPGKFDADRCRPASFYEFLGGNNVNQLEIWNFPREIQQDYVLRSYKGSKTGQYKVNLVFGKP